MDKLDRKDLVRAVCRALDVLQVINRLRSPTMMEIKAETGLPYATVYRFVKSLEVISFVRLRSDGRRYCVTGLATSLSAGYETEESWVEIALPLMKDLTQLHHWPVSIWTRIGSSMVLKDSTHHLTTQTFERYPVGTAISLFDSASGAAYLAFCSEEEREAIKDSVQIAGSPADVCNASLALDPEAVCRIRNDGFAHRTRISVNGDKLSTSAIAVPLLLQDGSVNSALALTYFSRAMSKQEAIANLVPALGSAAQRISAAWNKKQICLTTSATAHS